MCSCVTQRSNHDLLIIGAACANRIGEQCNPKSLPERLGGGLVDANRTLDTGEQEMVDTELD